MPARRKLAIRLILGLIAVSLLVVCIRRERLAYLYFAAPIDLEGTVISAALTNPLPMAVGDPRTRAEIRQVPTRMTLELAEHSGIRFQVMLPEDPAWTPPQVASGEHVVLRLPSRWRDTMVGKRALVLGLRRANAVLVDPANYSFADEFRTLFLGVGAAVGAIISGLGAWRLGRKEQAA